MSHFNVDTSANPLSWAMRRYAEVYSTPASPLIAHDAALPLFSEDETSVSMSEDSLVWDEIEGDEGMEEDLSSDDLSNSSIFSPTRDEDDVVHEQSLNHTPLPLDDWQGINDYAYRIAYFESSASEDTETAEENGMFSSSVSMTWDHPYAAVLDDVERGRVYESDDEEDMEVSVGSVELNDTSMYFSNVAEDTVAQLGSAERSYANTSFAAVPSTDLEAIGDCDSSADGEESERNSVPSPFAQTVYSDSRRQRVVRTRSGRISRPPDRYGDWIYY